MSTYISICYLCCTGCAMGVPMYVTVTNCMLTSMYVYVMCACTTYMSCTLLYIHVVCSKARYVYLVKGPGSAVVAAKEAKRQSHLSTLSKGLT